MCVDFTYKIYHETYFFNQNKKKTESIKYNRYILQISRKIIKANLFVAKL